MGSGQGGDILLPGEEPAAGQLLGHADQGEGGDLQVKAGAQNPQGLGLLQLHAHQGRKLIAQAAGIGVVEHYHVRELMVGIEKAVERLQVGADMAGDGGGATGSGGQNSRHELVELRLEGGDQFGEDRLLAGEVEIEGGLGEARGLYDVADLGVVVAARSEGGARSGKEARPARLTLCSVPTAFFVLTSNITHE